MTSNKPSKVGPIALFAIGILLALGPFWGALGTVAGMIGAFGELSQSGAADPEALATDISMSMHTIIAGIAIAPLGILFIILAFRWLKKVNQRRQELAIMQGGAVPDGWDE